MAKRDFYEILGVAKGADESEIKKAFDDFYQGKNGFQSRYWKSKNQNIKFRNKSL
jgi:hypothetical protein